MSSRSRNGGPSGGSKASVSSSSSRNHGALDAVRDVAGKATGSAKQVASKAKGPAVAVAGAAAAGVAGGLVLKGRHRSKRVLGVKVPRSLAAPDVKSMAKTVGKASERIARTSRTVSKDLDRAGDQAERIGKILG